MFLFLLFLSLSSGSILDNFPIKHFVVLMMENRSFDHLLGHLRQQNPDVDGLTGKETNPYNPYDPKSPVVTVNFEAGAVDPNAGHSVPATTIQVFGGDNRTHLNPAPMDGFVRDAEMNGVGWGPKIMSAFNSKSLPVLSTLATEFAVFDQWHASIPGPTEVNRAFFYSGTSNGYATNDLEELALGFPQKTVMQQFEEVGKDWGVFFELAPSTFFMRQLREDVFNFHTLLDFETVCQNGKLPTFSFLEPRYYAVTSEFPANDQHPDHNIEEGEKLIKWVYETVRASPLWNETALMILYDEHGGYYDHVPTPLDNVPSPDGKVSTNPPFDFKRSGVRVPVVVASPWVNKGTVVHKPSGPTPASQYEHSSFIATMKKIFGFQDFLTDRVKWAGTFEHLFLNRTSPRTDCPNTLPSPPTPRFVAPSADALKMNELQLNILASVAGLSGVRANKEFFEKATEADAARFVENQMKAHFESQGHYLDWDNKLAL